MNFSPFRNQSVGVRFVLCCSTLGKGWLERRHGTWTWHALIAVEELRHPFFSTGKSKQQLENSGPTWCYSEWKATGPAPWATPFL